MASKIELVKLELAFHGLRVTNDGQCSSFMEGQDTPVNSNCRDKIVHIKYEMDENKNGLKQFWVKIRQSLLLPQVNKAGGSPSTEKMFIAALKHLLRFSRRYKYFKKDIHIIQSVLNKDIKRFSETTMSSVIDYKICIDWIDHLVRQGAYCYSLLSFFDQHRMLDQQKTAQQLVPSGTFDMEGDEHDPLKERRWRWEDNDMKDDTRPKNLEALVGTDPEWLNEGFTWYEPRNEPYLYGDVENDPYGNTHYYNFKSEVHRDNKQDD